MKNNDVIVRAYGGEPLRRVAVDSANKVIYITTLDGVPDVNRGVREPTGFPKEDVFMYISDTYDDIRLEWEKTGTTDPKVWRSLSQFIFEA